MSEMNVINPIELKVKSTVKLGFYPIERRDKYDSDQHFEAMVMNVSPVYAKCLSDGCNYLIEEVLYFLDISCLNLVQSIQDLTETPLPSELQPYNMAFVLIDEREKRALEVGKKDFVSHSHKILKHTDEQFDKHWNLYLLYLEDRFKPVRARLNAVILPKE